MIQKLGILPRDRGSSSAEAGSPWNEAPILSISSSMITGLAVLASRMAWMNLPGRAPI